MGAMARFRSWWQQIKIHPVRTVLITFLAVVIVLIILSILGYIFNWDWTGLGPYLSPPHSKDSDFQRSKTLWDWLQLLIIPAVLAGAGYVINLTISRGEQEATKQRAKTEREIAEDNQRETALQAYIDKMSELILDKQLITVSIKDRRMIARVRTLTVLPRLDGKRKSSVLQFLHESGLIDNDKAIIDLNGADLTEAELEFANCMNADLKGVNFKGAILRYAQLVKADLSGAKLGFADLSFAILLETILNGAVLINANLQGASMQGAKLIEAKLIEADLNHAILNDTDFNNAHLEYADLSNAHLERADLSGANLYEANLSEADLTKANLKGVTGITVERLKKQAKSLKGATMIDGTIHE